MIKEIVASFWCVMAPVVENGDTYHAEGETLDEACEKAYSSCRESYHECEKLWCGDGKPTYRPCGD